MSIVRIVFVLLFSLSFLFCSRQDGDSGFVETELGFSFKHCLENKTAPKAKVGDILLGELEIRQNDSVVLSSNFGSPDRLFRIESPKPGSLDEKEFAVIKRHPEMGKQILSCMTMFDNLGDVVCAHHERYDGGGYPNGLKGTEIPEEARMIAIADSFDAMMSDRHYRKKLSLESSIQELIQGKGTQFDSQLVDLFLQVLEDYDTIAERLQWTHESAQE